MHVGFAILHPCLGLCSYARSTVRKSARWDTRAALAHSSCSAPKNHSSDAAVRKQRAFNREYQSWPNFRVVGSRLAKSRLKKHLHARSVASHIVNRARDACCPRSLTGLRLRGAREKAQLPNRNAPPTLCEEGQTLRILTSEMANGSFVDFDDGQGASLTCIEDGHGSGGPTGTHYGLGVGVKCRMSKALCH